MRLRYLLLIGIVAMISSQLPKRPTQDHRGWHSTYQATNRRTLPSLPALSADALYRWAKVQQQAASPGMSGLALRAFQSVAAANITSSAEAALQAAEVEALLSDRIRQFHYEAIRALRIGDSRTAKTAASHLRLEAATYNLDQMLVADELLLKANAHGF